MGIALQLGGSLFITTAELLLNLHPLGTAGLILYSL
jgi:hypothetical protein